ncbi:enediyne polyketide synthase [Nocardia tenerifensis]|uniref:Enediyne polyketide synthase n=1 Tax=Nocardia tenerifensis TaxID=228006 RepID=A0A318KE93_9NOCA|nr:type I polyketide synthase [Nocardia tenerifensis]PXX70613.1 enediyne polyketide synthase [Nocardia tenerifensis]
MAGLAIVGMACRFPDAANPAQLWDNVLARRRAFRPIPAARLNPADYYASDPAAADRHYATHSAVIEGWTFDRARHRVGANTFRSTDVAHWLALDTAAAALADAGFPAGEGLDRRRTGVILGNTLTGDMTRATGMRLRWPYVRRTLAGALHRKGWAAADIAEFLDEYEADYKAPFPAITEDTLAGGLANTIAGRICNHFDFGGGGFIIDGACSSSLLSIAQAGDALVAGHIDAAVVGGVDISIDPFELVGFAKTGALSTSEMRVYDERSNGFWPGEGCGILVLQRQEDAIARCARIYATIAGWGISSDGRGGITRPERNGHLRAIERAYRMAGFGIDTVDYLEGHGAGTAVGDRTELGVFNAAVAARDADLPPVAIGSIKANIGHTKAAAGIASLIKTTLAVHHGTIPPITGTDRANPALTGGESRLRLPDRAIPWPGEEHRSTGVRPRRAGVSSLGFGGINAHVVLESRRPARALSRTASTRLARSAQDAELFILSAATPLELADRLRAVAALAARCSFAELGDLATELTRVDSRLPIKAAVVAADQRQAADRLTELAEALAAGERHRFAPGAGQFLGADMGAAPRIGLMFPGQGAPGHGDGGAPARRFAVVADLYQQVGVRAEGKATEEAQPRIVTASLAGLRVLDSVGMNVVGCVGHSLGELTALYWAGVFDEIELVRIAEFRGKAMHAAAVDEPGTMATIFAAADQVATLLNGSPVVIAGYNGPKHTVIAGPTNAVDAALVSARAAGLQGRNLLVSHAFHSPLVGPAAHAFRRYLDEIELGNVKRTGLFSTVTAGPLEPGCAVADLLERQVHTPVRFAAALSQLAETCDLLVEVGPGATLSALAADVCPGVPVVAMETDGDSVAGILRTLAACYVLGAHPDLDGFAAERFNRTIPLDKRFDFIESFCENAPNDSFLPRARAIEHGVAEQADPPDPAWAEETSSLPTLQRLIAERVELPLEGITPETRPLDDLHLSSITITQLVSDAMKLLGTEIPAPTTNVATATIAELAEAIDDLAQTARSDAPAKAADELTGVDIWVRPFTVDLVLAPMPPVTDRGDEPGRWRVFAPQDDPFAAALRHRLDTAGLGDGVILRLGPANAESVENAAERMLSAARAAIETGSRLVVVDDGRDAAALAKTVHLEAPAVRTTVVHVTDDLAPEHFARLACADIAATTTFREIHYDRAGNRTQPVLRELPLAAADLPVDATDVVVVTGGVRGIAIECAVALARQTECMLAVIARSPADDPDIAANMARLRESGVAAHYYTADVTDREQIADALATIRRELGEVTGVLHGAGVNTPAAIGSLTGDQVASTIAPKVDGLHNLLESLRPAELRLVVGFGSIIGRAGLRGEGHYAVANDWLRGAIDTLADELPTCRCVTIEWSVWAGTGMGERLGVLDSLVREGIEPIPTDLGVELMLDLLRTPACPSSVVVIGRTGGLPTLRFDEVELPLLRFLERPRLHVPRIELLADADLSTATDPYLADHRFSRDALFPAVMGMEAMAQAATALFGEQHPVQLHDLEFLRPIVAAPDGVTTIRVAALRSGDSVRVAIRSNTTAFQIDHFRGVCRQARQRTDGAAVGAAPAVPASATEPLRRLVEFAHTAATATTGLGLAVDTDFYDRIMFHGPMFRSVEDYHHLSARQCVARIRVGDERWFSPMLPQSLVLDDPAARDAFMHAIQVCVPDSTLLPSKVARVLSLPVAPGVRTVVLAARERSHEQSTYIYDVIVRDESGAVVAIWEALELTAVAPIAASSGWTPELLGPHLQRRLDSLLSWPVQLAIVRDRPTPVAEPDLRISDRRAASRHALTAALGRAAAVRYRPDGRPEIPDGHASFAHGAGLTVAVVAPCPVGCDLEPVRERTPAQWADLLGSSGVALARLCGEAAGESFDTAATRVWSAREAVTKLGSTVTRARLTLDDRSAAGGWLALRHGSEVVWSFSTTVTSPVAPQPIVFSVTEKG